MYRGGSIETSGFSMPSILYESGPSHVMEAVESLAPENLESMKDQFILRWIHLPANNVSADGVVSELGSIHSFATVYSILTYPGKSENLDSGKYKETFTKKRIHWSFLNTGEALCLLPSPSRIKEALISHARSNRIWPSRSTMTAKSTNCSELTIRPSLATHA